MMQDNKQTIVCPIVFPAKKIRLAGKKIVASVLRKFFQQNQARARLFS
jgi:hypothetical protein